MTHHENEIPDFTDGVMLKVIAMSIAHYENHRERVVVARDDAEDKTRDVDKLAEAFRKAYPKTTAAWQSSNTSNAEVVTRQAYQISNLVSELDRYCKKISRLEDKLTSLNNELLGARARNAAKGKEIDDLYKELVKTVAQLKDRTAFSDEANRQNLELKRELDEAKSLISLREKEDKLREK